MIISCFTELGMCVLSFNSLRLAPYGILWTPEQLKGEGE